MFRSKGRLLGLVMAIVSGLSLAGCRAASHSQSTNKPLTVVTTTNFYGEVAQAVGGSKVQVHAIIKQPTVDPHDFEPTSQVATKVAKADIVIANGLGYDGWMTKLVKNAPQATYIRVGETVMHRQSGVNEHIWMDPQTMPKLVAYLVTKFSQARPKQRKYFQANAQRYLQTFKPVQRTIKQLKRQVNTQPTKQVLVSEPVFDDALTALGLTVVNSAFENAIEKGTDPAPKVIHAMQTDLKQRRVAVFIQNKQVTDRLVTNMVTLARRHHVPVVGVTETMPANKTYVQWQLDQYQDLMRALTKK